MSPNPEKHTQKKRGRVPKACIRCRLGKAKCVYSEGRNRCDKCITKGYECVSLAPGQTFEEALQLYNQRESKKNESESLKHNKQSPTEAPVSAPENVSSFNESSSSSTSPPAPAPAPAPAPPPTSSSDEFQNSQVTSFSNQKRLSLAEASAVAAAAAARIGAEIYSKEVELSPRSVSPMLNRYYSSDDHMYKYSIPITPNQLNQPSMAAYPEPSVNDHTMNREPFNSEVSPDWMSMQYNNQSQFAGNYYPTQADYANSNDMIKGGNTLYSTPEQYIRSRSLSEQVNLFRQQPNTPYNQTQYPDYSSTDSVPSLSTPNRRVQRVSSNYELRTNVKRHSLNMSPQSIVSSISSQGTNTHSPPMVSQFVSNTIPFKMDTSDMDNSTSSSGSSHMDNEIHSPFMMHSINSPQKGPNSMLDFSYTPSDAYTFHNTQILENEPIQRRDRNMKNLEIDIDAPTMLGHYPAFSEESPTTPTTSANFIAAHAQNKAASFNIPISAAYTKCFPGVNADTQFHVPASSVTTNDVNPKFNNDHQPIVSSSVFESSNDIPEYELYTDLSNEYYEY